MLQCNTGAINSHFLLNETEALELGKMFQCQKLKKHAEILGIKLSG